MAAEKHFLRSSLEDESSLRWGFLEDETEACVVVSQRNEIVYVNAALRELGMEDWFGKRCFEAFPGKTGECAWGCPTLRNVAESGDIAYGEETLPHEDGPALELAVAVIPLAVTREDPAKALLLLRPKDDSEKDAFRSRLFSDAEKLRERVRSQIG